MDVCACPFPHWEAKGTHQGENFAQESQPLAGGWAMAQVTSDRPLPHPSAQGV